MEKHVNYIKLINSCSAPRQAYTGASKTPEDLLTEESDTNPVSLYGRTKLKSEEALLEIADENFKPTILRMGTIYGYSPRLRLDLVINKLIAKSLIDKSLILHGGNQWRPNVHIQDVCDFYLRCIESSVDVIGSQIFNLGSFEQNYQIRTIESVIVDEIRSRIDLETMDGEIFEDSRNYKLDFSKIESVLKFKATHTIHDAISEFTYEIEHNNLESYSNPIYYNHEYLK